jgi:formyltetrahydrofolate synthetase
VHAGPFGNIAHAANSIVADRIALKLADYVITEAGFASDLGFQKFCDIVCRTARLRPSAAVLVTTVRATKSHGGVAFNNLGAEDLEAVRRGADNLAAHVAIIKQYGLPCVVTLNSFPTDSPRETALVRELALNAGAETVVVHEGFGKGGVGAVELANAVVAACDMPNNFACLTPDGTPVEQQIEAIATRIYGAVGIDLQMQAQKDLQRIQKLGLGAAPVCMAKTHLSLSHDPTLRNRPTGFILPVRSIVPSAGAGFVIALCGDMQRMPGFGKTPAFQKMDIDEQGRTVGLT